MANIQTYLDDIIQAIYGEEVRGSIHDAIDIINKVGEKTLTLGTAVTSQSSSITGYYLNSLYLNINTYQLWKCDGSKWVSQGILKGAKGDKGDTGNTGAQGPKGDTGNTGAQGPKGETGNDGYSPTVTVTKSGKVATITITDVNGPNTFTISDGNDGTGTGDMVKATYDTDDDGVVDAAETVPWGGVQNKPDIPSIAYSSTDLTPGTSPLTTGTFYFVYE